MSSDAMQVRDGSPRYGAHDHAQDVPPGYKRTEVGVVPKDWCASQLGDFGILRSGNGFPVKHQGHREGDYPFFKVSDMNNPGNEMFMDYSNHWIDEDVRRALSAEAFPAGSIVFAKIGAAIFLERKRLLVRDSCLDNNMMAYVLTDRSASTRFFHYVLLRVELAKLVSTTALPSLSGRQIASVRVPIPPPHEQRAIAEALSDVDALLGAADALIAKKRAIKQAAMQQLLTGKTRLPGFSGAWETKRLGRHVTFLRHGTHSRADLTTDEPVRNLHYGDIHTSTEVFLNARETSMPRLAIHRAAGLDRLEDGDLVLVDASEDLNGVGKSVELTGTAGIDLVAGLHTIAARFDKSVLADGFKGYLQFCPAFRQQLARLAAGTKVYATNRAHIASVEMALPHTDEQTAIATVLSDMDAEIGALEARRDKTRAIKQGMMQQLLTGRVRLVKPEATPEC